MEFKLLTEDRSKISEIQKKLNQWRHEYQVKVLKMSAVGENSLAVLIMRKKKEERRTGNGC